MATESVAIPYVERVLSKTEALSRRMRDQIKLLRRKHLDDLSSGVQAPQVSVAYLATLNADAECETIRTTLLR